MKIGFAILSYHQPHQLLRLVSTLTTMFDGPPIVCHHNFRQCSLPEESFPPNVRFVKPAINTKWGHITTPLAALRAFRLLQQTAQPDWYVLLSGTDYPCRSAADIRAELSASPFDAYLDHRDISTGVVPPGYVGTPVGFSRADWIPLAYERYVLAYWWRPVLVGKMLKAGLFPYRRLHYAIHNPRINRWYKAKRPWNVYGGAFWLQANARAVASLLDDSVAWPFLQYFKGRFIPEEALFHSILCNQPQLHIANDSKRFEDWDGSIDPHPQWIEPHHLPALIQSGAHFARKFRDDGVVQNLIDRSILGIASQNAASGKLPSYPAA